MGKAKEYINANFISKFQRQTGAYVGVEIELLLINRKKAPVEANVTQKMCRLMMNKFEFLDTRSTFDGLVYEMTNELGDSFAFNTTINTVEFSMGKEDCIGTIADRFLSYYYALQTMLKKLDYKLVAAGTNPNAEYIDVTPINCITYNAKADFFEHMTSHHNRTIFKGYTASTQTHIETDVDKLPQLLNLLGDIQFVDAYLFSNSQALPTSITDTCLSLKNARRDVINYRDILREHAEIPNTGIYEGEYSSLEDIENHLMDMKMYIVTDGYGRFKAIEPVSFREYFDNEEHPRKDMTCFRSMENVAPSYFGTVEIRSTCTQPIDEIFGPVAFYEGIAANFDKAKACVSKFYKDNNITASRSELRSMTIFNEWVVDEDTQREFVAELIAIAYEGLLARGNGEEEYMQYLYDNRMTIRCPLDRK